MDWKELYSANNLYYVPCASLQQHLYCSPNYLLLQDNSLPPFIFPVNSLVCPVQKLFTTFTPLQYSFLLLILNWLARKPKMRLFSIAAIPEIHSPYPCLSICFPTLTNTWLSCSSPHLNEAEHKRRGNSSNLSSHFCSVIHQCMVIIQPSPFMLHKKYQTITKYFRLTTFSIYNTLLCWFFSSLE